MPDDKAAKEKSQNVTIPRFLFENMSADSKLVSWLRQKRGHGWIEAIRKEMELAEKYGLFGKQ